MIFLPVQTGSLYTGGDELKRPTAKSSNGAFRKGLFKQ